MNGFLLYAEDAEIVRKLDDAQRGRLLSALYGFANGEEYTPIDPVTDIVFDMIRGKIERCNANFEKKRAVRKAAIEKRWSDEMARKAKKSDSIQTDTNDTNDTNEYKCIQTDTNDTYQTNPNQTNPNQSNPNQSNVCITNIYAPPTVDEVKAYCKAEGLTINAEKFVRHYNAVGWMVGNTKIVDWRDKAHEWKDDAFKNQPPGAKKPQFDFDQRHFDYDAFMKDYGGGG